MHDTDIKFLKLRVLIYFDTAYEAYIAQCLETGGVVTADDVDTVMDMMGELLEDEVGYAIEHQNFTNLLSTPAPLEIWARWYKAAKGGNIVLERTISINAKELRLDEQEVKAAVEMARAA
jgi:hypothetical protein